MTADFDDNIGDIIEGSKDTMMNMIYKAIINNEQDALSSNTPSQEKLSALGGVLQYFEGIEEYEKCYNIKKIMDKIC
jgi:hypothetical protein